MCVLSHTMCDQKMRKTRTANVLRFYTLHTSIRCDTRFQCSMTNLFERQWKFLLGQVWNITIFFSLIVCDLTQPKMQLSQRPVADCESLSSISNNQMRNDNKSISFWFFDFFRINRIFLVRYFTIRTNLSNVWVFSFSFHFVVICFYNIVSFFFYFRPFPGLLFRCTIWVLCRFCTANISTVMLRMANERVSGWAILLSLNVFQLTMKLLFFQRKYGKLMHKTGQERKIQQQQLAECARSIAFQMSTHKFVWWNSFIFRIFTNKLRTTI